MTVTSEQARGALVFGAGLILVAWAMLRGWLQLHETHRGHATVPFRRDWTLIATLGLLTAIGLALRLDGLASDTLAHPEIYVPNIALPAGISEPPPRSALRDVLAWHFHDEPHPQGYYFLMWPWTRIFGTGEWWLRAPSAIFGAASIPLLFLLTVRVAPSRIAWAAALLLTFNGHHAFWSELARMYAMVCFLGILATWLLLLIIQSGATVARLAAYLAVSWMGLFTDVLYWPFLLSHIIVCLLHAGRVRDRLFGIQMMVVMLGAPLAAHAVYRARPSPIGAPTWAFLRDFAYGTTYIGVMQPAGAIQADDSYQSRCS